MEPNPTEGQGSDEGKTPDLFTRALADPGVKAALKIFPEARVIGVTRLPDPFQAQDMLTAFASVGATGFDMTWLDIEGREQRFKPGRSISELRHTMTRQLETATSEQHSVVIRPRSTKTLLIQLDDFSDEEAAKIQNLAFLTLTTSPGNGQVWLAVSDGPKESDKEAAKLFRTRVRRGAGADHSATGATRIAGSLNFKPKYAPDFPVVKLGQVNAGKTVTVAELDQAGLIAPLEQPQPPASVPPFKPPQSVRFDTPRQWPDYDRALQGAPMKKDGSGPDRSMADFMFCKWAAQRGHDAEAIAEKLAQVSEKAQERMRKGDKGYALLTARNGVAANDRDRRRNQSPNPGQHPR